MIDWSLFLGVNKTSPPGLLTKGLIPAHDVLIDAVNAHNGCGYPEAEDENVEALGSPCEDCSEPSPPAYCMLCGKHLCSDCLANHTIQCQ